MKRLFDVCLVACVGILALVPSAVIGLAVRLTSSGPIFYWSDSGTVSAHAKYLSALANATTLFTTTATFGGAATSITVSGTDAQNIYPYMYITGTNLPANTQVASSYITGSTTVPITSTTTSGSSGNYTFSYAGSFVPTSTYQVVSSAIQEFVIAFGANSYSPSNASTAFDPMLVRWSDQESVTEWTPAATNQAGSLRLSHGSEIVSCIQARQEIVVFTDSSVYSLQYQGPPAVWSSQLLGDNISILSQNSASLASGVVYWMGVDKFYKYDGRVQTLRCDLRQYIFSDINQSQAQQVFSGTNEGFNEVWWFYCSQNSNTVDKYVIYNYLDKVWSYGTMARTAWLQYGINPYPIAADYNSRLLYHEVGNDDVSTATAQPITAYVQSSDFGIEAGDHLGFVWRMLPDVNFNGSTVNNPSVTMTVKPRQNSGTAYGTADNPVVTSAQNYVTYPQYTIQQFTGQVYTRVRGRQLAFNISSTYFEATAS